MDLHEISSLGTWSLSTFKSGQGIEQLLSKDMNQYWQSDGPQPHFINVQFPKKVTMKQLSIYLDYSQDESYTPKQLSIRAGNTFNELQQIQLIDLEEPVGWRDISLLTTDGSFIKAYILQIAILSNHQNGKDTHVRGVHIFSSFSYGGLEEDDMLPFSSLEFQMYIIQFKSKMMFRGSQMR